MRFYQPKDYGAGASCEGLVILHPYKLNFAISFVFKIMKK